MAGRLVCLVVQFRDPKLRLLAFVYHSFVGQTIVCTSFGLERYVCCMLASISACIGLVLTNYVCLLCLTVQPAMSDQQEFFNDDGNVDDSKLKLPDVEFAGAAVKSGEEEEEVLYKTCVR